MRAVVALLLLSACKNAPHAAADPLGAPVSRISWREVIESNGLGFSIGVNQVWTKLEPLGADDVYRIVETEERADGPFVRAVYEVYRGPSGFGYLATDNAAGRVTWDPPEVIFPAAPKVGDRWTATHLKGARSIERSCEILASELCPEGLVSVCDATSIGGDGLSSRTIVREHLCPDVGWAGYESMFVKDTASEKRWTEELTRTP